MDAAGEIRRRWRKLTRFFVPAHLREDPDVYRRARIVVGFALAPLPFVPLIALVYARAFEAPVGTLFAGVIIGSVPVCLAVPFVLRRTGSMRIAANLLLAYAFVLFAAVSLFAGGSKNPTTFWNILLPMGALALAGKRSAAIWTLICMAQYGVTFGLHALGVEFPDYTVTGTGYFLWFLSISNLTLLVMFLVLVYEQAKDDAVGMFQRANRALLLARDEANAANRSKSQFLANISHEIRTPMTAILGFTELLLEEGPPSGMLREHLEALRTVQRNGAHLLEIINDILDLSKVEAGRLEVKRIAFSPIVLAADVVSLMRVRAEAEGLELRVEYATTLPETIQGDPTRLKQVLVNLIGNAIKFTARGEVGLGIRLLEPGAPPQIEFSVVDTGIGIAPDKLERLFEPFTQIDASATREYGGTGLGLVISRRLVALMGGELSVESTPGQGSTFRFSVPIGSLEGVAMIADPARASAVQREDRAREEEDTVRLAPDCRILLVEDSPDNRRLISHLLRRAGAEVALAENGRVAIDLVAEMEAGGEPFDVILMDMQMPVLDGYGATRELRRRGYTRPIVALTAHAMAGEREKCLRSGCDAFATKPVDRAELLATLAEMASRAKSSSSG